MSLWQSPEAALLAGFGAAPQGRPQVDVYFRRSARGESPNSPVDCLGRGDALQERASPKIPHLFLSRRLDNFSYQKGRENFSLPLYIWTKSFKATPYKAVRRSLCGVALRERPLLQGVPSFPTVHRTVGKFTLCGAPEGCIDLRSICDSVPNPARGAASGLCKRGIAPFKTRFYRPAVDYGTPSLFLEYFSI